jgi:ATP-dependent Clp protease ATP-binding subunit ClpC
MANILTKNILLQWLTWHFLEVPRNILRIFKGFLLFNFNYFSVPFLLKTLLAPWRKYGESYGRGFDLKRYLETFIFNSTSRILGAIVRIVMILVGLIFEVFIFISGAILLFVWIFLPILLIISLCLITDYASGAIILIFNLAILFFVINSFFKEKREKAEQKYNLDYEAGQVLSQTENFARTKKIKIVSEKILLYFLLKSKIKEVNFIFNRGYLNLTEIQRKLKKEIREAALQGELSVEQIIFGAAKIARNRKREKVNAGDILISFVQNSSYFQKILMKTELKKEDIENLATWFERVEKEVSQAKKFWEYKNLLKKGFLGKDWASGFTITLDEYSSDLREEIRKNGFRPIVGHKKEIERVERILEREILNNILLVGDSGSGRKSVVEGTAQKAFLGLSSSSVNYKRFLKLNLGALVSETNSSQEIEAILDRCFSEVVRAGNVILILDEFQDFLQESPGLGVVNISGVLSRYLHLSTFQIIAITTFDGLHKVIERRPGILNLFEKVEISEISPEQTLELLENYVGFFEKKYKKFITYPALREIVRLSALYIQDAPFPEKALSVLDEVMVYVARSIRSSLVLPEHISHIVSEKIEIPIGEIEFKEKEVLLNLESLIHKRIINQEEAVREAAGALRRARAGVQAMIKPIGTFLFLGPTGVGKTETSKALTEIYFGREDKMIRLDMSEFQSINDISRLIGSTQEDGLLTTAVRESPFSLILFDEIEKAHPNILNLFLQVLDEGRLTDGLGRKVDFKQTIIIATSNAGAEVIRQDIEKNKKLDMVKDDLLDYLFRQGVFRPEFINRFDAVVIFKPLTKENLLDISQLMLDKLRKNLSDKGIEFEITEDLKEKIVELGYSPVFGAREIRRTIQNKVENVLANAILSGELKKGDKVRIEPENFELIIS